MAYWAKQVDLPECATRLHGMAVLSLNQTEFTSGEVILGSVQLTIRQALRARSLVVAVDAIERVGYTHMIRIEGRSYDKPYQREKRRFRDAVQILTKPRDFEEGVHTFSFELQLSSNFPSVFVLAPAIDKGDYRNVVASLTHRAVVILDVDGGADIASQLPIVVHASPHEQEPVRALMRSARDTFRKHVFAKSGNCTVCVTVSRDVFSSDESIPVTCEITNDTHLPVTSVVFRLVQMLSVGLAGESMCFFTRVLYKTSHSNVAPAGDTRAVAVSIPVCYDGDGIERYFVTPTRTKRNGVPFECRYRLEVECYVSFSSALEVKLPVRVVAKHGVME